MINKRGNNGRIAIDVNKPEWKVSLWLPIIRLPVWTSTCTTVAFITTGNKSITAKAEHNNKTIHATSVLRTLNNNKLKSNK